MIVFLTSSPTGPLDGSRKVDGLDDKNQFIENLHKYWKENSRALMISAFPENVEANIEMRSFFEWAFKHSGFSVECFDIWDARTTQISKEVLFQYDVILLGGGHVPTQNRYFQSLHLKEMMEGYQGIVIGISAGTMNSSEDVYSQPEEEGESVDPLYKRHLKGLGLTKTHITPHYQMVKDYWLDGKRLYEDIVYPDTMGMPLLAFVDGTYLLIENGNEWIYGQAYLIEDGHIEQICEEGQSLLYRKEESI